MTATAKNTTATIIPTICDYAGRDYSCRDPEGFLWNFGTYDPWTSA